MTNAASSSSNPVLGYWKIRGLAHPIRYLLHYVGQEYEDAYYEQGDGPEFNRDCWISVKPNIPLAFPNLPYLLHGDDFHVSQSNAIIMYFAEQHGLAGKSPAEKALVQMVLDEVNDVRNRKFVPLCYRTYAPDTLADYLTEISGNLQRFEKFYGDKKWICGTDITAADFLFYEILDCQRALDVNILKPYPRLAAYCEQFEALPKIKAFMSSPAHKLPFNNKVARFGGRVL